MICFLNKLIYNEDTEYYKFHWDGDKMYNCALCKSRVCRTGDILKAPSNCPCLHEDKKEIASLYMEEENYKIAREAALVESSGYCKKTRVEEIMDFANKCGYKNLGLAFCIGLSKEAKIFSDILKSNGFEVNSVICKNGSIPKEYININQNEKVHPGNYEPMCNPIGQANFLNKSKTDFNIILGLCVGHDSLFIKYSEAPTTVLAVKDRVLGHNPIQALYMADGYFKKRLYSREK